MAEPSVESIQRKRQELKQQLEAMEIQAERRGAKARSRSLFVSPLRPVSESPPPPSPSGWNNVPMVSLLQLCHTAGYGHIRDVKVGNTFMKHCRTHLEQMRKSHSCAQRLTPTPRAPLSQTLANATRAPQLSTKKRKLYRLKVRYWLERREW